MQQTSQNPQRIFGLHDHRQQIAGIYGGWGCTQQLLVAKLSIMSNTYLTHVIKVPLLCLARVSAISMCQKHVKLTLPTAQYLPLVHVSPAPSPLRLVTFEPPGTTTVPSCLNLSFHIEQSLMPTKKGKLQASIQPASYLPLRKKGGSSQGRPNFQKLHKTIRFQKNDL